MFKNLVKKHPKLGSSANPEKLSLSIKGAVPLVIALAVAFGVDLQEADLIALIDQLVLLVTGAMTAYGLLRKIYYAVTK